MIPWNVPARAACLQALEARDDASTPHPPSSARATDSLWQPRHSPEIQGYEYKHPLLTSPGWAATPVLGSSPRPTTTGNRHPCSSHPLPYEVSPHDPLLSGGTPSQPSSQPVTPVRLVVPTSRGSKIGKATVVPACWLHSLWLNLHPSFGHRVMSLPSCHHSSLAGKRRTWEANNVFVPVAQQVPIT